MDTKQLKAKILDLAIHGKLLPLKTLDGLKNSPDYEPASKLLEKLRAEKEEKIAKEVKDQKRILGAQDTASKLLGRGGGGPSQVELDDKTIKKLADAITSSLPKN